MCHKRKLLNKINNKFNGFVHFIIALSLHDTFLSSFSHVPFLLLLNGTHDTFTKI